MQRAVGNKGPGEREKERGGARAKGVTETQGGGLKLPCHGQRAESEREASQQCKERVAGASFCSLVWALAEPSSFEPRIHLGENFFGNVSRHASSNKWEDINTSM